ncbi:hypothetical protein ACIPJG_32370 [Streptomyces halstedii]|uniref:hypothetical protein n=1 Tax=Streptomyces halstedii TaxID=1944 RepID=UPI00381488C7
MQTITVPAVDIRPGDRLCGDDGVPFALVSYRTGKTHIKCLTRTLDDTMPFLPVRFPVGTSAVVQR